MDKYLGKRLDGRYEIREIIGVGGMAVVYKAYDNVDDKIVAIKILKEEFTGNDEFLRRFKNESKAIAVLSHPNVVKVFDVSFGDLIQYIVMEYIDGITLKEYIEQHGQLSWNDAVKITLQILRGLQHAHDKGVVHRDIKPHNIMILSDGTIKVTDFGIARFARSEQRTITDKAIGSVHYISPEQARGDNTDDKADIYSVGVMLYEMITSKLPFEAESAVSVAIMQLQKEPILPRDINGSIPLGLEQITMHAMQKESDKRYKSAAEMLCDLEEFKKNPAATFDYDYFVDDSPTKFIPIANNKKTQKQSSNDDEKSPMIPVLTGILITFIIAIIIVGFFLIRNLLNITKNQMECGNFINMNETAIKADDALNDLYRFDFVYENNNDYEPGAVFKQDPEPGQQIIKGGKVTLYVSTGEKLVLIPDITNMAVSRAINELENKGFIVIEKEIESEMIPEGNVVKTNPNIGSRLKEGSTVEVYISTGIPMIKTTMPDVIGLPQSSAEKDIEAKGLKIQIEPVNSFVESGTVLDAYVDGKEPGQDIYKGETVILKVSRGFYLVESIEVTLPNDYRDDIGFITLYNSSGKVIVPAVPINLKEVQYKHIFTGIEIKEKISSGTNFIVKISAVESAGSGYDVLVINIKINNDGTITVKQSSDRLDYPKKNIAA